MTGPIEALTEILSGEANYLRTALKEPAPPDPLVIRQIDVLLDDARSRIGHINDAGKAVALFSSAAKVTNLLRLCEAQFPGISHERFYD